MIKEKILKAVRALDLIDDIKINYDDGSFKIWTTQPDEAKYEDLYLVDFQGRLMISKFSDGIFVDEIYELVKNSKTKYEDEFDLINDVYNAIFKSEKFVFTSNGNITTISEVNEFDLWDKKDEYDNDLIVSIGENQTDKSKFIDEWLLAYYEIQEIDKCISNKTTTNERGK